ncbi:MAG: type II secretion system protein M [Desulfobacterales bacterium]|jgi:general secretion pathway protein M|nr:type II secretion system protein M [Desulfobacterales bacterium]
MKFKLNLNLNKREKAAVSAAGVFIAFFVLIQFIITPVFERRNELRERLNTKKEMLVEMNKLQQDYFVMQKKLEISRQGFARRPPGFTLFSFLDKLAGETGVKNSISYMKPSSVAGENSGAKLSKVEMKLQGININDLVSYLYGIENSENMVVVRRLSITKAGQGNNLLSVVIQVETIES